MSNRRSFLGKIGATALGLGASSSLIGEVSGTINLNFALSQSTDARWEWPAANHKNLGPYGEHTRFTDHLFQGSNLSLIEVFETDTDGWEAYVGLNSHASYARYNAYYDDWGLEDSLVETKYHAIKSTSSFDKPILDSQYRGFEPGHDGGKPALPEWVDPAFDTAASGLIGLASSNPYSGLVAGVALTIDDIADVLEKDDGKHEWSNGYQVKHTHKEANNWIEELFGPTPTTTDRMAHYQRMNFKCGEDPSNGFHNVRASFTDNGGNGSSVKIGYYIDIWNESNWGYTYDNWPDKTLRKSEGAVLTGKEPEDYQSSQLQSTRAKDNRVDPDSLSQKEREKYGVVDVTNGVVSQSTTGSTDQINRRVASLNASLKDREVTRIALNPPVTTGCIIPEKTSQEEVPKAGSGRRSHGR